MLVFLSFSLKFVFRFVIYYQEYNKIFDTLKIHLIQFPRYLHFNIRPHFFQSKILINKTLDRIETIVIWVCTYFQKLFPCLRKRTQSSTFLPHLCSTTLLAIWNLEKYLPFGSNNSTPISPLSQHIRMHGNGLAVNDELLVGTQGTPTAAPAKGAHWAQRTNRRTFTQT